MEPPNDSGGGGSKTVMDVDVSGEKLINNGLLCSILHALSSSPGAEGLVARVERDCTDVAEILKARKKLFTYFSDVMCNDRKKLILDIERQTTKNYIKDIVDQMIKVDRVTEAKMFCMPYDYELKRFETDDSRLTKVIEKELSSELDMKIEALENRINEKHRALHDSILDSVNRALGKPS